eukprot:3643275-Pyramimonas_sp.AAC.1
MREAGARAARDSGWPRGLRGPEQLKTLTFHKRGHPCCRGTPKYGRKGFPLGPRNADISRKQDSLDLAASDEATGLQRRL